MKLLMKVCSVFMSLALIAGLASCKDNKSEPAPTFKVVSSTIESISIASEGQIVLSESGFEYKVNVDWITLSLKDPQTIALAIADNPGAESRTASVVIVKGKVSQSVPVLQMGKVNRADLPQDVTFESLGGRVEYDVQFETAPEVSVSADWVTCELKGDKLVISAPKLQDKADRVATVSVKAGDFKQVVKVTQKYTVSVNYADFLGEYILKYITGYQQPEKAVDVKLEALEEGKSYILTGLAVPMHVSLDGFNLQIKTGVYSPKPSDVPENSELVVAAWGMGFPKPDGSPHNGLSWGEDDIFVGTWNKDLEKISFAFAHKSKPEMKGIHFFIFDGKAYEGAYGDPHKVHSVGEFSMTKK